MPVARYFLYVGGVLIALLFAVAAIVPPEAAVHSAPGIDRSTVRIHSDQKLPERVVYDTTLPTIVPASKVQTAAAPAPVPALDVRPDPCPRHLCPVHPGRAEEGRAEGRAGRFEGRRGSKGRAVAPPKKRKIARVHSAPPDAYPPYGPPMRVAPAAAAFGFFGGPIWNTW